MNDYTFLPSNSSYHEVKVRSDWIVPITINILLLLSTLWMLISLLHHGIKTEKWKKSSKRNTRKRNGNLVYTSLFVIAVFCFLHLLFSLVFLNVGFNKNQDLICAVTVGLITTTSTVEFFSLMTYLWLRQRSFYSHPLLSKNYSRPVKVLSFASIIFLYVGGLVRFIVLRVKTNCFSSLDGCYFTINFQPPELFLLFLVLTFLISWMGQIMLLGLLAHALKSASTVHLGKTDDLNQDKLTNSTFQSKTVDNGNELSVKTKNSRPPFTTLNKQSDALVKKALRKTLIFSIASVVTNIITLVIASAVEYHPRIAIAVFNSYAFLYLLYASFTFAKFQKILFWPYSFSNNE